jgi:hypothetical protein
LKADELPVHEIGQVKIRVTCLLLAAEVQAQQVSRDALHIKNLGIAGISAIDEL